MIVLTSAKRTFIPSFECTTSSGKTMNNRDEENDEQVSCEIRLASIEEKSHYMGGYNVVSTDKKQKQKKEFKSVTVLKYRECVKKHCTSISGLEEADITDGKSLVAFQESRGKESMVELDEIIKEIFQKVNGFHDDDDDENPSDSHLSSGE